MRKVEKFTKYWMSISFCCDNFYNEKRKVSACFFHLLVPHSTVRAWRMACASRCMSIVYDINMHHGLRVRSVTNRVLIMNENNTRASISKHTFLGVKPSGSTTPPAEAWKISCPDENEYDADNHGQVICTFVLLSCWRR